MAATGWEATQNWTSRTLGHSGHLRRRDLGGPGRKGGQAPHGMSLDARVFCVLSTFCLFKSKSQKGTGGGHTSFTAPSPGCCLLPLAQPLTLLTPSWERTRRTQKWLHITSAPLLPWRLPLV